MGPKEAVYDEQTSPLVKQINVLCKEHGISVMSYFVLDVNQDEEHESYGQAMRCLSYLPVEGDHGKELLNMVRAMGQLRSSPIVMTTVTQGGLTTVYKGSSRGLREE